MKQCVVFCRTNVDCINLEAFLTAHKASGQGGRGYSCCVLAGKLSPEQRK